MDINKYLRRINYKKLHTVDEKTLNYLHETHVLNIPFENLDIHFKILIDLDLDSIYRKVIENKRGGFCYELNFLFSWLLLNLGFKSRIIASRIYDDKGKIGPEYDHMSIFIEIDNKQYLADVGFGDLFVKPLEIKIGFQSDGRNQFIIEKSNDEDYILSMITEEFVIQKKYIFSLNKVKISDFEKICFEKQTNPLSYFVKNTICTKPTKSGRLTIFNNKIIEKKGKKKFEKLINNEDELRLSLKTFFNIVLKTPIS
ncbi:acetyltransferase [Lacihabitans sp. LS3-19]|uniref:arylamine N-acetyltransferase family protein n=1 Tax=Lacihabitans sp. LS3-19 TaxID=2487335 RepID=UPI0020CED11C|nr:arylamine N-acetyltransferase [Lacihabitans sp. LS3-19]MCP9770916.1 acetyltransferase [Lacihabitans sp. LS3-19]